MKEKIIILYQKKVHKMQNMMNKDERRAPVQTKCGSCLLNNIHIFAGQTGPGGAFAERRKGESGGLFHGNARARMVGF